MVHVDDIKKKVEDALPGAHVEAYDQSAMHIEHEPTGIHVQMIVKFKGFEGKSKIEQHQMVYGILQEELKEQVHALALTTEVE